MDIIVRNPRKKRNKYVCYSIVDNFPHKPKTLYHHSDYQVMGDAAYCGQLEFARRVIQLKKSTNT